MVQYELNPDIKTIVTKFLAIQSFIGLLTLLFCPQFGLSLTNNHDLFHYFHYKFGTHGCYALCGAIFIGTGAFFTAHLLKMSELRMIRSHKSLFYFSLSLIAISLFLLLGAEIYFSAALAWILGSAISGVLMLELNSTYKGNSVLRL